MIKPTKDTAHTFLKQVIEALPAPLSYLCKIVLEDKRFNLAPGGATHHHNYEGGLIEHTAEVVYYALSLSGIEHIFLDEKYELLAPGNKFIDPHVLITAAIWHDYMKILEYSTPDENGKISRLKYTYLIGHPMGSVMVLRDCAVDSEYLSPDILDKITHCMLAHHGRKEWGSPVEPKTPEAWLLHAADMLSAQPL